LGAFGRPHGARRPADRDLDHHPPRRRRRGPGAPGAAAPARHRCLPLRGGRAVRPLSHHPGERLGPLSGKLLGPAMNLILAQLVLALSFGGTVPAAAHGIVDRFQTRSLAVLDPSDEGDDQESSAEDEESDDSADDEDVDLEITPVPPVPPVPPVAPRAPLPPLPPTP